MSNLAKGYPLAHQRLVLQLCSGLMAEYANLHVLADARIAGNAIAVGPVIVIVDVCTRVRGLCGERSPDEVIFCSRVCLYFRDITHKSGDGRRVCRVRAKRDSQGFNLVSKEASDRVRLKAIGL